MAQQGVPVTIVAAGGMPVVRVGGTAVNNGVPMTVLTAGGAPITIVTAPAPGIPVHLFSPDGSDYP